jgi:hypothetical protein
MDIQKEAFLHNFKTLKNHCSILDPAIIKEYFPDGNFETALNKFFDVEIADVESFYGLDYPFQGEVVFSESKFIELVEVIPEFIVSVIKVGMPFIVSLHKYQKSRKSEPVLLSLPNLVESSKIVYHSWNLFGDLLKQETAERQSSITELEAKLGQLVRTKPHYDLLGTLQNVYNSIVLMAVSEEIFDQGFFDLFIHPDKEKRETLYSLAGRELSSLRTLNSITDYDSLNDLTLRIRQGLLQNGYPKLNQPRSSQISEGYIVHPTKEVTLIEEPATQYGQIDGLVLHLPEDQTTDQSPVYLDFISDDNKITDIELSHMEAAFLYYLGAERNASETLWLSFPEKQYGVLRKIWKSFCLPDYFEDELALIPPIKGITRTWIWDFENVNRKNLSSQIRRKIGVIPRPSLKFKLIVPYKSSQTPYGGNYKLNNQIKSFEIIKPTR